MRTRSTSGLTLLEMVVSTSILAAVILMVSSLVGASADTVSAVGTMTATHTEAERILAFVAGELRGSTLTGPNPLQLVGGSEVRFTSIDMAAPIFDPADPTNVPWSPIRKVIRLQADGAEVRGNGVDDDKDFLVDEGRVVLYSRVGTTDTELVSFGPDIGTFSVSLDTSQGLPRVRVVVRVERVLRNAIKGQADLDALAAGGGPRLSHTAETVVTLIN
jgi:hypothetical protein